MSCCPSPAAAHVRGNGVDTDLPGIQEPRTEDHDGLTRTLLELHLDGRKLLVDNLHHALYLLGGDGTRPRLLPQQVHHVRRELVTRLQQNNSFVQNRSRIRAMDTRKQRRKEDLKAEEFTKTSK